jgi:hypothetical protein
MKLVLKNKTFAFAVFLLILIVAMTMTSMNSNAQKNTNTLNNIVVVKKHVYNDPKLTAQKTYAWQKQCTSAKEALYAATKQAAAAPKDGDYLSIDEITKLHNVTVTEYFRGNDYARYEVGQTWDVSFQNTEQNKLKDSEIYCRIIPKQFTKGEIRTAAQTITFHKTDNEQGVVEVRQMRPGLLEMIKLPVLAKDLVVQKVKNANTECLSKPELSDCYFKDIPIHSGTKKVVVVESKRPAKGLNKSIDATADMTISNLGAGFGDGTVFKADDYYKVYENISVTVGKEISNSKFEIPDFAKDYKTVNK